MIHSSIYLFILLIKQVGTVGFHLLWSESHSPFFSSFYLRTHPTRKNDINHLFPPNRKTYKSNHIIGFDIQQPISSLQWSSIIQEITWRLEIKVVELCCSKGMRMWVAKTGYNREGFWSRVLIVLLWEWRRNDQQRGMGRKGEMATL